MSPWVRFCSNGFGRQNVGKPGFVFFSGKDFYSGYGFTGQEGNKSIIGYVPTSPPGVHTIENELSKDYPIHVPSPEIEKVQVQIIQELYRKCTVEWTCFSKAQLEYMTPYFLVPGITCVLEWGWNHYNPKSLIDLTSTTTLKRLFNNPYPLYTQHILHSRGNYDVMIGIITLFEWSIDGNKIKCKTEITSKDRIYAGLVIDSSSTESEKTGTEDKKDEKKPKPLDSLVQFTNNVLPLFKDVSADKAPESKPQLSKFVSYIKTYHPNNWKEYVYGVFYGRDLQVDGPLQKGRNKEYDFDYKSGHNVDLWLNLGLVIEAINFHSAPLLGMNNEEMFRVDIDDVVISGHPNLISTDGNKCLIPNAIAPKYFYGSYGPDKTKNQSYTKGDWAKLVPCTRNPIPMPSSFKEAESQDKLPDYRLGTTCEASDVRRDDIDAIINRIRYENPDTSGDYDVGWSSYEFPFYADRDSFPGSKPYPAKYSGLLKHIYVNIKFLQELLNKSEDIKTYPNFIKKIMEGINSSCGNFWDFKLVDGTGYKDLEEGKPSSMKIVDYKFMAFANQGTVYTFDYMDADSLLLGLNVKVTMSDVQATRTVFAPMNNDLKQTTLTNGNNELLDYKFKDRLFLEDDKKKTFPKTERSSDNYIETIRTLQQLVPCNGSYQITSVVNGQIVIRRLAMPATDVLLRLLDDEDEKNNPKYTGIMPGIRATFTIQGIGGFRTFMMFLVRNLPEPYSHKNIVFRIVDVQETIEMGKWITVITAGIIPLREHIKKRLGINNNSESTSTARISELVNYPQPP